MFPLIKHIFSLLDDSFRKRNVDYEIMGLHWRGGEDDTGEDEQYMAENPKLTNPVNWAAVATIISVIGVFVSIVALFVSCV
jgi:hypothetical protein